jgi:iron(III) transport system ATP-binding protein
MSFLELQSVRKRYGTVTALDGIDLGVAAGSRTAIVGPSGSGKTTLLRVIAGFETPDAGRVTLDGRVLSDGANAIPAHHRSIGFVAQDGALFPHLSVGDNVGFGLDRGEPGRAERIAQLMDMVELDAALLRRKPDELSGGQQQRVALARALARKPQLMLLDEPFSALDTGLRDATRKAVARLLSGAGITTILVTHDQPEALSFADQVAVMREGRLTQVGGPRALYLQPKDRAIAEFLGEAIVMPALLADGWAECALGRVAVDDRKRRGLAQIMLRPEQVSLVQVPDEGSAKASGPDTPFGEVMDVEFGGAVCTLSVRLIHEVDRARLGLNDRAEPSAPLQLRRSSNDVPPVGAIVRIAIVGAAHVFDEAWIRT